MPEGRFSLPWVLTQYRHFGGFPVDVDPCDPANDMRQRRLQRLIRPILSTLAFFVAPIVINKIQMWRIFGGVTQYDKMAEAMGIRLEDATWPLVFFCVNFCMCLVNLGLFVTKHAKIVKLYKDLAFLESKTFFPSCGNIRGSKLLWLGYVLIVPSLKLVASACYATVMARMYMNLPSSGSGGDLTPMEWMTAIAFGVGGGLTAGNPLSASAVLYALDVILSLGKICSQWESKMKAQRTKLHTSSTKKPLDRVLVLEEQLSLAQQLCELAEEARKTIAPFIFVAYLSFLSGGIMYVYEALAVLIYEPKETNTLLLGVANFLIAMLFYGTLFTSSIFGSCLENKKNETKAALSSIVLDTYKYADDFTKFRSQKLLEDLDASLKIAPYGYFDLSNSNFLGVIATNATYIIVLLQFRSANV